MRAHGHGPRQWVVYRARQDRVHVLGANGLLALTVRYRPREAHELVPERRSCQSGCHPWTRPTGPCTSHRDTWAVKAAALQRVEGALRDLETRLLAAMRQDAWSLRGEALVRAATAVRAAMAAAL